MGRRSPLCRECAKPGVAAAAALRRERARGRGRYTAGDVRAIGERQGWMCACGCQRSLRVFGYHVDHVVSLKRGGLNVASNLQLLAPKCNLVKSWR